VIRAYQPADADAVAVLLSSAWPEDAELREISAIHGPDSGTEDRWRRTLVFVAGEDVVGAGTLLASARHPTRYFAVVVVAPSARRRRIASRLLAALVELGDGRPLLARVRENDAGGREFLRAHGFAVLMRNRVGVLDPDDLRVQAWIARAPSLPVETGIPRNDLAQAHEEAYAAEHASWAPATKRPLDESLQLFCGESWLPASDRAVRDGGRIVAVASLHGPPLAPSQSELFLIAGAATGDVEALRAVVAAELDLARSLGASVSIEADDANAELSRILDELPARMEPTLLLLSTDAVEA
jgi:GNAT superfamily N-acetyltransferase